MRNEPEVDFRRLWIPIVCFLVAGFAVLPESPYRNWVHSVVGVQSHGDSPKDYLAEQIATGVSAGSGLLLILLLAVFTSRDSWYWTFMGVFPALMLLLKPIVYAVALLWGCFRLIDSTNSQSLIHDNALEDRSFIVALSSAMAFGIYVFVQRYVRKVRPKSADSPDRGAPLNTWRSRN